MQDISRLKTRNQDRAETLDLSEQYSGTTEQKINHRILTILGPCMPTIEYNWAVYGNKGFIGFTPIII